MERMDYHYLFPYEYVPAGSKILIYGAGELGQDYLVQMQLTHYCEVVAMADKNFAKYPPMVVPVIDPETIQEWAFDYVVIALRVAVAANAVLGVLKEQGIEKNRIVCIFERTSAPAIFTVNHKKEKDILSCDENDVSMALLITGGLGDHVIQKRLLCEIMRFAPELPIDIYAIRHVDFLKYLYSDCESVRYVIEDLGTRYNTNCGRYTYSMSIEACHYLRVDEFKKKVLTERFPELAQRLLILERETKREGIDLSIPVHVSNTIRLYRGLNAYSGFNYNGAFAISDKDVSIPRTEDGAEFYRKLELPGYITVNYGSGECRDGSKVAKMWPLARFEATIAMLKEKYPRLCVVQLGATDAPVMRGTDRQIIGEPLGRAVSVLEHALFHLDIEGGLVHIASQIGTKCIVLFGPTVEKYYGYENNINIHAGGCHNCWALYSDVNRCAREMRQPECMYSITPELVMEYIDDYLSKIKYQI